MACIQEQDVERYHDAELPPDRAAAFEAHLAACPACRALLSELRGLSSHLAGAGLAAMPADLAERLCAAMPSARSSQANPASGQWGVVRLSGWLTAAAAAVLLATLVGWPTTQTNDSLASMTWESLAVSPSLATAETNGDSELIVLAQWMADELSTSKRSSE